jgi:hypothetical protein
MLEYGEAFNEQNAEAIEQLETRMGRAASDVLWGAASAQDAAEPAEDVLEAA